MAVAVATPRRTRRPRAHAWVAGVLAAALAAWAARASHGALAHEDAASPSWSPDSFAAEMHAAMREMDAGMAIAPTGDPDIDFARMMIPHHQGAVDMALAELRYGRDERLRRLAQEIIVEQRQEIEVMQRILQGAAAARAPADSAPRPR